MITSVTVWVSQESIWTMRHPYAYTRDLQWFGSVSFRYGDKIAQSARRGWLQARGPVCAAASAGERSHAEGFGALPVALLAALIVTQTALIVIQMLTTGKHRVPPAWVRRASRCCSGPRSSLSSRSPARRARLRVALACASRSPARRARLRVAARSARRGPGRRRSCGCSRSHQPVWPLLRSSCSVTRPTARRSTSSTAVTIRCS
jgi:hypothetical protein